MRSRKCNQCKAWSRVDEWGFGCPACGHTNGRGDVSYSEFPGVLVMPDIQPYQSMLDGSQIGSRSTHRNHLRQHNAIELGNETATLLKPHTIPDTAPRQRTELLRAQFDALTDKQVRQFVKRDVDRIKWQTRED